VLIASGGFVMERRLHPEMSLHPQSQSQPQLQMHPQLHPQPGHAPQQSSQGIRPITKAMARNSRAAGVLYQSECVLGKGSFGIVCKASVVGTHHSVAIKTVKLRDSGREVEALQRVRGGPNVVTLLGCFEGVEALPQERSLNLVLEFVSDTLQRIIKHHRQLGTWMDMHFVRLYMHQLLRGLACLTRHRVVHRDIKPANLLVDPASHTLKVCDFGTSKFLDGAE
ncbi:unnamed protein product, partial [Polarella glacialis]